MAASLLREQVAGQVVFDPVLFGGGSAPNDWVDALASCLATALLLLVICLALRRLCGLAKVIAAEGSLVAKEKLFLESLDCTPTNNRAISRW